MTHCAMICTTARLLPRNFYHISTLWGNYYVINDSTAACFLLACAWSGEFTMGPKFFSSCNCCYSRYNTTLERLCPIMSCKVGCSCTANGMMSKNRLRSKVNWLYFGTRFLFFTHAHSRARIKIKVLRFFCIGQTENSII